MANRLKMANVETILHLHGQNWSNRRIAKELGVHRDTVARIVGTVRQVAGSAGLPVAKQATPEGPPLDSKQATLEGAPFPSGTVSPSIEHGQSRPRPRRLSCQRSVRMLPNPTTSISTMPCTAIAGPVDAVTIGDLGVAKCS